MKKTTGCQFVKKEFDRITKQQLIKEIDDILRELPDDSVLVKGHFRALLITSEETDSMN